jgi:hypothetical protein
VVAGELNQRVASACWAWWFHRSAAALQPSPSQRSPSCGLRSSGRSSSTAGLGTAAPLVLTHHRLVLGQQVRVGFTVGLVLLLGLAGLAFPVGGTVSLLAGDLGGFFGLLGLLSRPGKVAPPQEPTGTRLQRGELVVGLLLPGGRIGEPLFVLFASLGRMGQHQRPVPRRGVEFFGKLVASCAKVVLAAASTCRLPSDQRAIARRSR